MSIFANGKDKHITAIASHHLYDLEFLSTKHLFHLKMDTKLQAAVVDVFKNERFVSSCITAIASVIIPNLFSVIHLLLLLLLKPSLSFDSVFATAACCDSKPPHAADTWNCGPEPILLEETDKDGAIYVVDLSLQSEGGDAG